MRKDVKIGLSIGSLFLLLLLIYFAAPTTKKDNGVAIKPTPAPPPAASTITPPAPVPAVDTTGDAEALRTEDPFENRAADDTETADQGESASADDPWTRAFESPDKLMVVTPPPHEDDAGETVDEGKAEIEQVLDSVTTIVEDEGKIGTDSREATESRVMKPSSKTHEVKEGETLSSIAQSVYDDSSRFQEIQDANPEIEPTRLQVGVILKLPDISGDHRTTGGRAAASIDSSKEYRVGPNDSLYTISLKLYGKSDRVDALYQANREKIGSDPAMIRVGMVLKLPETPRATTSR